MSYMTLTKITEEKGENDFATWSIPNFTQIKNNNIIKCLSNSCSKHAAAQNNKQRHI